MRYKRIRVRLNQIYLVIQNIYFSNYLESLTELWLPFLDIAQI